MAKISSTGGLEKALDMLYSRGQYSLKTVVIAKITRIQGMWVRGRLNSPTKPSAGSFDRMSGAIIMTLRRMALGCSNKLDIKQ